MPDEKILKIIEQATEEEWSKLDLSSKGLDSLPPGLENLRNLTWLDLSNNKLNSLSAKIENFKELTWLDLSKNRLRSLPRSIGELKNLTWLNISKNRLKNFPVGVTQLPELTWLYLGNNRLRKIPKTICKLQNLSELDLNKNILEVLPPEILQLQDLNVLDLNNNNLSIPYDIIKRTQEPKVIIDFFKQKHEETEAHLHEAKIIILGEGEAGKTTLAKKIRNPNYKLKKEKSTVGIDISQWHFFQEDQNFQVNIWDFSGQEIDHSTHQFFLTEKALYILVVDSRRENTDYFYWLNAVKLLGKGSPLLIIKNEKDGRKCDIPEHRLRAQFLNLKESFSVDLAKEDFTLILDEIKHHISRLSHIQESLPKSWVSVRNILGKDKRNYINIEDFFDVCHQCGLKENQLQLSEYLHNLGAILHFQEIPHLKKIIILKHKWCTDAVYKVFNSEKVKNNFGTFTRSDLITVWNNQGYAMAQDELLQLMKNFDLCYELSGSPGTYLAPQLLGLDPPDNYEWDDSSNLALKYEYEFMVKGILARFIVETQGHIEQSHYWRSGVVLNYYDSKAEVIEKYNYYKGEINIRVAGKRKKDLITIIEHEIDKIHRLFKNLKVIKKVPCNCSNCRDSAEPCFYESYKLREMVENQKMKVSCDKPPDYYDVDILELINDITDLRQWLNIDKCAGEDSTSTSVILIEHAEKVINQDKGKHTMSNNQQNYFGSGDIHGDITAGDKNVSTTNIYNNQDLAQAAAKIKNLLDQLSQDYDLSSPVGKSMANTKILEIVSQDKNLKQKVVQAIKAMGEEALEQAIQHPVAKMFVAGAKEFI